jgi:hypothetical protein
MNRDPYPRHAPPGIAPELSLAGYLPSGGQLRPTTPPPTAPAPPNAIAGALERLEELIDRENHALAAHEPLDFADLNRRKSQSLLEVTRLSRALPPGTAATLAKQLGRLRDKLTDNHRVLGLHVNAVREIANLIVRSLTEAESDGTYGMGRRGKPAR